jgi:hypothetical protein
LSALFDDSDLPPSEQTRRPAMVYFLSLEPDPKSEKRLFNDFDVATAARYFDCVKVYVEDIEREVDRNRYAKTVPTILFLDSRGKEVSRLAGSSAASSSIFGAMQKTAAQDYKDSLGAIVRKYQDFLEVFDKVASKVDEAELELAGHQEHLTKHDCARGRNSVKEVESELVSLRANRDKLLEQEKPLLKPKFKEETAPEGTRASGVAQKD